MCCVQQKGPVLRSGSRAGAIARAREALTAVVSAKLLAPAPPAKAKGTKQTEIYDRELGSSRWNKSKVVNWFQPADRFLSIFAKLQRRRMTA
jgi:hypothetical protein